ncbi:hypothetical protein POM88_053852 [Heracleum sosnowskyi]|uniref:Peptidase C1A papain C-terminal domain-containing protein n=1 Tax=Heracleum sosnowskyi TaxID=360622 RepID=A0AAD8GN46_9APIA|nr:hypothetical protein POM88_053852 [Heracleum sosnowskyi]
MNPNSFSHIPFDPPHHPFNFIPLNPNALHHSPFNPTLVNPKPLPPYYDLRHATVNANPPLIIPSTLYHYYCDEDNSRCYLGHPVQGYQYCIRHGLPSEEQNPSLGYRCTDNVPNITGIYYEQPGDVFKGNHAVVVVAMNLKEDYFIIRNSWSEWWGMGGYAKVKCDQLFDFSVPVGRSYLA